MRFHHQGGAEVPMLRGAHDDAVIALDGDSEAYWGRVSK
jgi:hypothetical protein